MDFDNIIENARKDFHHNYNGMYLSERQVEILKKYNFNYNDYNNIEELIFDVNNYLNENNIDELEIILEEISEYNYYANTNK